MKKNVLAKSILSTLLVGGMVAVQMGTGFAETPKNGAGAYTVAGGQLAEGSFSLAAGSGAVVSDTKSIGAAAIGMDAKASGNSAITIGTTSEAAGDFSTLLGGHSKITADSGKDSGTSVLVGGFSGIKNSAFAIGMRFATEITDSNAAIAIGTGSQVSALPYTGSLEMGNPKEDKAVKVINVKNGEVTSVEPTTATAEDLIKRNGKGYGAIAIGQRASSHMLGAVSVGLYATSAGMESISMGSGSVTTSDYGVGMGSHVTVSGDSAIALGKQAGASATSAVAMGKEAEASGERAIAIGALTTASGEGSVVIGSYNSRYNGYGSTVSGKSSVAIGDNVQVSGSDTVAIGSKLKVAADNAVVMGHDAGVKDGTSYGVALGYESYVNGYSGVAIGKAAKAGESSNVAIGEGASAAGVNSLAMTSYSRANDAFSIAIGREAQVGLPAYQEKDKHLGGASNGGIAIGKFTKAYGNGAIALGRDSFVSGDHSVAIGKASVATEANTVSFGIAPDVPQTSDILGGRPATAGFTRRLVNVSNGINGTDVATVNQLRQIRTFDVTLNGAKVNVLGRNGEFYNISDLTYEGGKYYKTSDVAGMMYSSDGKFYDIAALKNHTYILPDNDSVNQTGGYYDNSVVKMNTSTGNYYVTEPGAQPVAVKTVPSVDLEGYKLNPEDKLKLSVENVMKNGKPVMALSNIADGEISETSTDAINGSQLKALADKLGVDPNATGSTDSGLDSVSGGSGKKPGSLVDATKELTTAVNKGMLYSADQGDATTKHLGDTLGIKTGTLTDTSYSGTNLQTEVKEGNILIGMKDKPVFKGITINREGSEQTGDTDVLTKKEVDTLVTGKVTSMQGDMPQKVTANTQALEEAKKAIAKNTGDIATNTTGIAEAKKDIVKNAGDISKNTSAIATNTGNITKNAGDIATNTGNITKNAGDIATNTGNISKNTSAIEANKTALAGLEKNKVSYDSEDHTSVTLGGTQANPGNEASKAVALHNVANGSIAADSLDAVNGSQLKALADKLGIDPNATGSTDPGLDPVSGGSGKKPGSLVDATKELTTAVNKGMLYGADQGSDTTKHLGDTLTVKTGTLTDSSYSGTNLQTEVKDGNIVIGMKDKATFKGIVINRDSGEEAGDTDVLTKKEVNTLITSTVNKIQGDIPEKVEATAKALKEAEKTIAKNTGDIATNKTDIAGAKKDIAKNAGDIATNTGNITQNTKDIAANKKAIDKNTGDIATNKTDIAGAKKDIAKNAGDITKNTGAITTNTGAIATNTTNIATNKTDIAGAKKDIAKNTGAIATNTGNIATNTQAIHDVQRDVAGVQNQVMDNRRAIGDMGDRLNGVGALNAAMSALTPLDYNPLETTEIMAGAGYYKGQTGVALGVAYHENNNLLFRAGLAYNSKASTMINGGITWRFGHKKQIEEVHGEDRMLALQQEVEQLKAENRQIKEMLMKALSKK